LPVSAAAARTERTEQRTPDGEIARVAAVMSPTACDDYLPAWRGAPSRNPSGRAPSPGNNARKPMYGQAIPAATSGTMWNRRDD
jgi:hypothetical protein